MIRVIERMVYKSQHSKPVLAKVRPRTEEIGNPCNSSFKCWCFGLLLNPRSLWVGVHYSRRYRRTCINLLPGITLWVVGPNGVLP